MQMASHDELSFLGFATTAEQVLVEAQPAINNELCTCERNRLHAAAFHLTQFV
jgi:hypothetical protein